MPTEKFSHTANAAASRDAVWAALDLPGTWEAIPGVDRVLDSQVDGDGRLQGFSFESVAAGKKYLGKAKASKREEGRTIALDVETSEIVGTITVDLDDAEDGTVVSVALDVSSSGFLSSMFFPVITKTIGSGFPVAVQKFARGFETD